MSIINIIGNTISNWRNRSGPSGPNGDPSSLTVTVVSDVQLDLAWVNGATNHPAFEIERKLTSGGAWAVIGTTGVDAASYSDTTASVLEQYDYQARAVLGGNYSAYSNTATARLTSAKFWIVVDTTKAGSANNTFVLPTTGTGYSGGFVDWGDGGAETALSATPGNVTKVYAASGTYTVKIRGNFPRIYFNGGGDRLKLIQIKNWGNIAWSKMINAFSGCSNMTGTYLDFPNTDNVTDMSYMFQNCMIFNRAVNFNTSNVTDMSYMFQNCKAFNQAINFNTANVLYMTTMFRGCTTFNQVINFSDTSKVQSMLYMIRECAVFNQAINFNTGNVTNMGYMFQGCSSFKQDISFFNFTKIGAGGLLSFLADCNINAVSTTTNYDNLLVSLSGQTTLNSLVFSGGISKYSLATGKPARDILTNAPKSWTITDGGM
jgi:hypothetical protein